MGNDLTFDGAGQQLALTADAAKTEDERYRRALEAADDDIRTVAAEADEIQRKWPEFYDDTPCCHCLLDAGGIVIQINNTGLACFGYAREEIVGKKRLVEMISPAGAARFTRNLARLNVGA
jgi:PAS domain-containing protein